MPAELEKTWVDYLIEAMARAILGVEEAGLAATAPKKGFAKAMGVFCWAADAWEALITPQVRTAEMELLTTKEAMAPTVCWSWVPTL